MSMPDGSPSEAEFLARFPELTIHPAAVVRNALIMARLQTAAPVWGPVYYDGVSFLAASIVTDRVRELAATIAQPMGKGRRAEESENFYRQAYEDLFRTLPISGFFTSGAGLCGPGGSWCEPPAAPPMVGSITLLVAPQGPITEGQTVLLTAVRSGGSEDATLSYAWAGPVGTSAPLDTADTETVSWIARAGDSGSYTVTVSNPGARDSPQIAAVEVEVVAREDAGLLVISPGHFLVTDTRSRIRLAA